jgi:hypothetical protein
MTIAGGIATCFFGGYLWEWVVAIVPAFFVFLFVSVMLSSFGLFSVLEKDEDTTGSGVFKALVGSLIALAAAVAVGYFLKKTETIATSILGAVGGFFAGFLLYSLVFAQFITASPVFLWVILFACTAAAGFATFKWQEEMEVHLSAFIGAYLVIRGIAFFLGGYPNEAQTFAQLASGNFKLPGTFYIYLAVFVGMYFAGNKFQHYKGYD